MPRTPPQDPPRSTLVVVRHGDAGEPVADPARDGKRALSEKGRKQARRAGRALARLELLPRDVWTSHLVRAVETAAVARAEPAAMQQAFAQHLAPAIDRLAPCRLGISKVLAFAVAAQVGAFADMEEEAGHGVFASCVTT